MCRRWMSCTERPLPGPVHADGTEKGRVQPLRELAKSVGQRVAIVLDGPLFENGSERTRHIGHGRGHLSDAALPRRRQLGRHRIAPDERAEHSVDDEHGSLALSIVVGIGRRAAVNRVARGAVLVAGVVVGVLEPALEEARLADELVEYFGQLLGLALVRLGCRHLGEGATELCGQLAALGCFHLDGVNESSVSGTLQLKQR